MWGIKLSNVPWYKKFWQISNRTTCSSYNFFVTTILTVSSAQFCDIKKLNGFISFICNKNSENILHRILLYGLYAVWISVIFHSFWNNLTEEKNFVSSLKSWCITSTLWSITRLSSTIKIYRNKIIGKYLDLSFFGFQAKDIRVLALEII